MYHGGGSVLLYLILDSPNSPAPREHLWRGKSDRQESEMTVRLTMVMVMMMKMMMKIDDQVPS